MELYLVSDIPYHGTENVFDISHLASRDPLLQFTAWFDQMHEIKAVEEPNAMAVATATKTGVPSIRMVLCKEFNEKGFLFFTNYGSKKGHELDENPKCSLMFYWEPVKRQIRIEGVAEKISAEKSAEYFNSRPKDSQLGAVVSKQSSVIPDRQVLDTKLKELQLQYSGDATVPKPDYWEVTWCVPMNTSFGKDRQIDCMIGYGSENSTMMKVLMKN